MIDAPFKRLKRYSIPTPLSVETRGSNAKKVWFIADADSDEVTYHNLMDKIAASVGLSLENDVQTLFVLEDVQLSYTLSQKPEQIIVVFGPAPKQLGLNLEKQLYQITQLNGHTFLFSDSLSTITTDQQAKRALWSALKALFVDKS